MPFGFWYIFQDDMIACEPPQVNKLCVITSMNSNISYQNTQGHFFRVTSTIFSLISVSTVWSDFWSSISNARGLSPSKSYVQLERK